MRGSSVEQDTHKKLSIATTKKEAAIPILIADANTNHMKGRWPASLASVHAIQWHMNHAIGAPKANLSILCDDLHLLVMQDKRDGWEYTARRTRV